MSTKRITKLLGAFLFAATTAVAFSHGARAETGILWLDSVYAVPYNHSDTKSQWKRVSRTKLPATSAGNYAAPPAQPRTVQVASARTECFWCNQRVTGLSF